MILTVRGGGQIDARSFALTDMVRWGYGGLRNIQSVPVTDETARGIPALHRAAQIRAEALASLRLRCWRGEGPTRERDDGIWQARLFKNRPNDCQTRFQFWETVGESLAWRNKAFLWKNVDPITMRVVEWWALHPDQVKILGDEEWQVTVTAGYPDPVGNGPGNVYKVDDSTILPILGHGHGGRNDVPTPIEVFRDALAAPVARQRHEAKMWRKGATVQFGVEFPAETTVKQAQEWQDQFKQSYLGTEGDTVPAIGGGATFKPIGMTAADAAYVEMAHLTVEDASLIMGVSLNLLIPAASGEKSPQLEEELRAFLRFGMTPTLERIESAVSEDDELFGSSTAYAAFDTANFVRGDLATEAAILHQYVQDGIFTPDEARHELGYGPHPGGVGAMPQITPVGGAPNELQPDVPAEQPDTNPASK